MNTLKTIFLSLFAMLSLAACSSGSSDGDDGGGEKPVTPEKPDQPSTPQTLARYAGGDISLLTKYEEHGAKYLDENGKEISGMLSFLKDKGLNCMRVRLFVNPENASSQDKGDGVCQDLAYVKALGKRIKAMGFRFMLDFHYSDSWADPAKQFTPKAWEGLDDDALAEKVGAYTSEVLEALNASGATPDFIQTGNEISYGMLWGKQGDANLKQCYINKQANWQRFTTILKKASAACRLKCPKAGIVLHTERVGDDNVLLNFYEQMRLAGVDYDIIGLSFYPFWHGNLNMLEASLGKLEQNIKDKPIMIVETGYYAAYQPDNVKYNLSATYPVTPAGQKAFLEALIRQLRRHDRVTGLLWWNMEANECGLDWETNRVTNQWNNYSLFDNSTGKAQPALAVLKNFLE